MCRCDGVVVDKRESTSDGVGVKQGNQLADRALGGAQALCGSSHASHIDALILIIFTD